MLNLFQKLNLKSKDFHKMPDENFKNLLKNLYDSELYLVYIRYANYEKHHRKIVEKSIKKNIQKIMLNLHRYTNEKIIHSIKSQLEKSNVKEKPNEKSSIEKNNTSDSK